MADREKIATPTRAADDPAGQHRNEKPTPAPAATSWGSFTTLKPMRAPRDRLSRLVEGVDYFLDAL
jgi:hypothetical protein